MPLPGKSKDQKSSESTTVNRDVVVKLKLASGDYRVTQIDTKTGDQTELKSIRAIDEAVEVQLAPFITDVSLLIKRK